MSYFFCKGNSSELPFLRQPLVCVFVCSDMEIGKELVSNYFDNTRKRMQHSHNETGACGELFGELF